VEDDVLAKASKRVEGGLVEVEQTGPRSFVASWVEEPEATQAWGLRAVPDDVAAEGLEAAIAWAVAEWDRMQSDRAEGDAATESE
jgi:hypothetical protein